MRCLSTQVPRNEYPKLVATTHLIRLIKVVRGLKRCAWTSQITSRDNPRQRFSMVRSRCSPFLNRRHACPWRCNTIRSRNQHPCTLPFSASQTLNPINCALGCIDVCHTWPFVHARNNVGRIYISCLERTTPDCAGIRAGVHRSQNVSVVVSAEGAVSQPRYDSASRLSRLAKNPEREHHLHGWRGTIVRGTPDVRK